MYRNIATYTRKSIIHSKTVKQQYVWMSTWDADGNRIEIEEPVRPYLYFEQSSLKKDNIDGMSMYNVPLKKMSFDNSVDRSKFIENSKGIPLFGKLSPTKQFLQDRFKGKERDADFSKFPLKTYFFDIEVQIEDCFPKPEDADYPINIISIYDKLASVVYAWAYKSDIDDIVTEDIEKKISDEVNAEYESGVKIEIFKFNKESSLLKHFLDWWQENIPDILTGWNIDGFDMPYLFNRIYKVLDHKREDKDSWLSKLSPLYSKIGFCVSNPYSEKKAKSSKSKSEKGSIEKMISTASESKRKTYEFKKEAMEDEDDLLSDLSEDVLRNELMSFESKKGSEDRDISGECKIMGVSICDYLTLYKKFIPKSQQSFKLDYIAKMDTGKGKLDYYDLGYESMRDFMVRDFATFLKYNIIDSTLVKQIDDRKHFIDLMRRICNMGLVEYECIYDSIPYILGALCIEAWHQGVIFLTDSNKDKSAADADTDAAGYEGAYVFPTKQGFYSNGIMSFDFNSLYPSCIMTCNMSPETMVGKIIRNPIEADGVKEDEVMVMTPFKKKVKIKKDELDRLLEEKYCISGNEVLFLKSTVKWGIIPSFLEKLYAGRVQIKNEMKKNKKLAHELEEQIKDLEKQLEECKD